MAIDQGDYEKLAEVRAHLQQLRRALPKAIKGGTVSPHAAAHLLRTWEAIETDYVARITPDFVAA